MKLSNLIAKTQRAQSITKPSRQSTGARPSSVGGVAMGLRSTWNTESAIDEVMAHQTFTRWTLLQREQVVTRLLGLKFFKQAEFARETVHQLLPHLRHQRFSGGEVIFSQGDRVDYFYVIVAGAVEFVLEHKGKVRGLSGRCGGGREAVVCGAQHSRVAG